MVIQHSSISKKNDESFSQFLHRVANEVQDLEKFDVTVEDVIFNFPDESTNNIYVTATIYYLGERGDDYKMDVVTLRSKSTSKPSSALHLSLEQISEWSSEKQNVEIHDVKTDMLLDNQGKDFALTKIYFSEE